MIRYKPDGRRVPGRRPNEKGVRGQEFLLIYNQYLRRMDDHVGDDPVHHAMIRTWTNEAFRWVNQDAITRHGEKITPVLVAVKRRVKPVIPKKRANMGF